MNAMPKTWNKIKAEYPGTSNKGLRDKIFQVAQKGGHAKSLLLTVAFSNPQLAKQKLDEIDAIAATERK